MSDLTRTREVATACSNQYFIPHIIPAEPERLPKEARHKYEILVCQSACGVVLSWLVPSAISEKLSMNVNLFPSGRLESNTTSPFHFKETVRYDCNCRFVSVDDDSMS